MPLKELIDEQVQKSTVFPPCRTYRAAFLLWSTQDPAAEQYARDLISMVKELPCDLMITKIGITSAQQGRQLVSEKLNERHRQTENGEINCPKGYYVLVIEKEPGTCSETAALIREQAGGIPVTFNRIHLLSPLEMDRRDSGAFPENGNDIYRVEWYAEEDKPQAAQMLLAHFVCEEKEISANGRKCMLKFREYSAAREDMCGRFRYSVSRQLKSEMPITDEKISTVFEMNGFVEAIVRDCPRPEWLPIIGADQFLSEIHDALHVPIWQRLFGGERGINVSVDYTLRELFGEVKTGGEELSMPEWLRKSLAAAGLPRRVREEVYRSRETILRTLLANFTLQDIIFELPRRIMTAADARNQAVKDAETRIRAELDASLRIGTASLPEVKRALGSYMDAWRNYIEQTIGTLFLNSMADFITDSYQGLRGDYDELLRSENVLRNCEVEYWDPVRDVRYEAENITSERQLRERIIQYHSYFHLPDGEAARLIRDTDRAAQNSPDYSADVNLRPEFLLCYHSRLDAAVDDRILTFTWERKTVSYLPDTVLWELRKYRMLP